MKRISWILGIAAAATLTSAAGAQSAKSISLGISLGAAIPAGDFADLYTTGYNGTASLMFRSIGSPLGLRVDGMYNRMDVKDDAVITIPGVGFVESASITSANANLVYHLPGAGITPYLIGGGGMYWTRIHVEDVDTESENDFGINGGIGASFPLSGFNTFIEARLHHIFTERSSTQFIPVTFGISL